MIIQKKIDLSENETTPESIYRQRRFFLQQLVGTGLGLGMMAGCSADETEQETLTSYKAITTYNNFYEFGVEKTDPAKNAGSLKTSPWTVTIEGECEKPGVYSLEDILKPHTIEQRIYRFRCVEGWSMVVPWHGFELGQLLKRFQPTAQAKYVYFETLYDPEMMPEQQSDLLEWPYREGLRIDEAMHPLTLVATGLYDKPMPNQNGAPLRLVIPWKYGFKSLKSLVTIRFTEYEPVSTWQQVSPEEYGFYSNVNPHVSHPRWSQARERRIGELTKRDTLMFNGYADEVAHLYKGMDLKKHI